MFKRILTGSLIFGMVSLAPPAFSQGMNPRTICSSRDAITTGLQQKFEETQKGAGLETGSRLFELWHSPETGSWTILLTRPNGTSCIMASGSTWKDIPAQAAHGDPA